MEGSVRRSIFLAKLHGMKMEFKIWNLTYEIYIVRTEIRLFGQHCVWCSACSMSFSVAQLLSISNLSNLMISVI